MEITANIVHQLREDTGSGLSTCQSALKLTNGNYEEAVKFCKMGETRYLFCTVIKLTEEVEILKYKLEQLENDTIDIMLNNENEK